MVFHTRNNTILFIFVNIIFDNTHIMLLRTQRRELNFRFSEDRNAALGRTEDVEMDMVSVRRNKIPRFFGPFDTGNRLGIIHEIFKTDIFQFLNGIQTITIEVVKRDLRFVDMHKNKSRALNPLGIPEPQPSGKSFDKGRLPAPELSFQAKNSSRLKLPRNPLRKLNGFLGRIGKSLFFHIKNERNLFEKVSGPGQLPRHAASE